MKFRISALTVAASIMGSTPALAADRFGDFYLGLRLIGSYQIVEDTNAINFTGTRDRTNENDFVAGGGGVVGYRFFRVPLRMEIEAAHRYRFDWDNRDQGPQEIDFESNVDTTTVLFNAILDWRNDSAVTPYIGISVGWARNHNETTRTVLAGQAKQTIDDTSNEVAYGVMLGLDWAFNEDWSAGLAYRYLRLGEVATGTFAGGDAIESENFDSHDVLLNVNYTF